MQVYVSLAHRLIELRLVLVPTEVMLLRLKCVDYFSRNITMTKTAKVTTALLQQLRRLMADPEAVGEPIKAYIVPSGDAHMVIIAIYSPGITSYGN